MKSHGFKKVDEWNLKVDDWNLKVDDWNLKVDEFCPSSLFVQEFMYPP